MKKILLFSFVTFAFAQIANAQCDIKATAKADEAYNNNAFDDAIELYNKAAGKVKGKDGKEAKSCIAFQIAKCYLSLNDYKKAESQFKKVMKGEPADVEAYFVYGNLLKSQARYEEARVQFEKYLEKNPTSEKAKASLQSCNDAINWMNNPTCYQIENLKIFNDKMMDFSPVYSNKKQTQIIFASNRAKSMGKESGIWGELNEDLWVSDLSKGNKWSAPTPIVGLSSDKSEGAVVMNSRYNMIYFTRCFGDKKNGSGCQIYSARRMGPNKWGEAMKLELFPDSFVTGHPALTPDDKVLVFSSNVPGGEGGMDLYYAVYDKKTKGFTNPTNLGKEINTAGNEVFPFIKSDGTLYFSSDKPEGMGGLDIYKSASEGENKWGKPENMRYPINSEADDFGIVFKLGEEAGMLSSNRKGSKGGDDIWAFSIPQAKIMLSGTVRDKDTKEVLADATVELTDAQGNKFTAKTDATGYYKKEIPFGVAYDMIASKKDYYNDVNRASTMGLDPLKTCRDTNIIADFYLKTQRVDLEFEIQFIFDREKWFPEYNDTVKKILTILLDNPTMVAEIGAHTDTRGNDDYNQKLSERRANEVVKYLVDNGIDAKRLKAKGYGETSPRKLQRDMIGSETKYVFKKDTELTDDFINEIKKTEGDKVFEDAHRLNRRVVVKKLSDDYKAPKSNKSKNDEDEYFKEDAGE